MRKKPSKQLIRISIALGLLALALSACGGNSKVDKNNASSSASASPSVSASASETPSPSASESTSASPTASASASDSPSASPSASAPASNVAAGFKLFEDKTNGTSIQYPKDWTLHENIAGAVAAFVSPKENDSDFQDNVFILVKDLGGKAVTLEQFGKAAEQSLVPKIANLEIATSELKTTEDGTEVYILEYTGKQDEFKLVHKQAYRLVDGKVYILTFAAESANVDKFEEVVGVMADSWSINE